MSNWHEQPGDAGRKWFEQTLLGHTRVRDVRAVDGQTYVIERHDLPDVRVWLCDIYTLGIADYMEIRAADPTLDAIVVLSQWNSYTPQAKLQGTNDGVGVFKPGELMSALHREGDEFARDSGS